jgi:hypothetical protein
VNEIFLNFRLTGGSGVITFVLIITGLFSVPAPPYRTRDRRGFFAGSPERAVFRRLALFAVR